MFFVNTSATISLVFLNFSIILFFLMLSLSKWNFISIYFNFEENSPFSIIILLDLLSVYIVIGDLWLNNSYIMFLNHRAFLMHSEALMNSASAVEVATIVCFLEYHEMGELPIKNIWPDVDFRSSLSQAKSASVYPWNGLKPLYKNFVVFSVI